MATRLDAWPETDYPQQIHPVFYVVVGPRGLKLGISSGDGSMRLVEHRRAGYGDKTVRLWTGLPGRVADATEDLVLARLKRAGHKPIQGLEYFNAELLAVVLGIADHELVLYTPRVALEHCDEFALTNVLPRAKEDAMT